MDYLKGFGAGLFLFIPLFSFFVSISNPTIFSWLYVTEASLAVFWIASFILVIGERDWELLIPKVINLSVKDPSAPITYTDATRG